MNLIELVVAIVIISIAAVGVLMVYAQAVRFSADPMVEQQAVAVAEGYLDEVLARPMTDPSGSEIYGSEEGDPSLPANRPLLDDVFDYDGLSNSPPQGQDGVDLDLPGYTVSVAVTRDVDVGGVLMAKVDVRVRYAAVVDITLTGYRAPAN